MTTPENKPPVLDYARAPAAGSGVGCFAFLILVAIFIFGAAILSPIVSPRASFILPILLCLVAIGLLCMRKRKSASAPILAAVLCVAWYGWVNWHARALPIGSPVAIDIEVFDPNGPAIKTTVTDPTTIAQIARPLSSVYTRAGRFKVNSDYRIIFRSADGSSYRYRLARSGHIYNDVPPAYVQDVYLPREPLPLHLLPALPIPTTSRPTSRSDR
jgi:hypothetical protein